MDALARPAHDGICRRSASFLSWPTPAKSPAQGRAL